MVRVRVINYIALKTCLTNINNIIYDKDKDIGKNNLAMLDQMITSMQTQVKQLIRHKKDFVFGGDKSLVSEVFSGLHQRLQ